MSDIIQRAKKALEGTTPGPWELYGGEIHQIQHTPEQCTSFRCDHRWPVLSESWGESAAVAAEYEDLALMAAAPEMAQALAEEEYQYGVTYIGVNHGGHHIEWVESTGDAELDEDRLQIVVKGWKQMGQSPKVVRRRVSQPEVISEEL